MRRLTLIFVLLCLSLPAQAARQFDGVCSVVKMEILQELTLERIGFLATLEITNNESDASITDFSAALTFQVEDENGELVEAADLFFVQAPELRGVRSIDGTGVIRPGETATISWFIIPTITAGGTDANGINYNVGALLGGSLLGEPIDPDTLAVIPDTITVRPEPQLEILYFQPRDVQGDNPFTPNVESPIPFTLGVRVKNVGYGTARKLKIASEQPRIVENEGGLLLVPQLLGARVDDDPLDNSTLTVDLGNIEPSSCRKASWDMITSLSGEFTEFEASYTHDLDLGGGRDISVITAIDAHFMVAEVLNDQPGRDSLLDFLATTDDNTRELIPDTLFESDCNTLPVNHLQDVELLEFANLTARIRVNVDVANHIFFRLDDPGQARYDIVRVTRSDGKVLDSHNSWTNMRYREEDNARLEYLNVFDFAPLGEYEYLVEFSAPEVDLAPPVSQMLFSGPREEVGGINYITPETQMLFLVEDASPVSSYYRLDGGDTLPGFPFTVPASGAHVVEFWAEDASGNIEDVQRADLFVTVDDPALAGVATSTGEVFTGGNSVTVRPEQVEVSFDGQTQGATFTTSAEVYRGVYAFPTLAGTPSSPTRDTVASLTVGGHLVDFYQYRVGVEDWSDERPVDQVIELENLSGTVIVSVRGRSQHSTEWNTAEQTVTWEVNPLAPLTAISGTPASPSRTGDATFTVSNVELYRWRFPGSFYRAEAAPSVVVNLNQLDDGQQALDVIGRNGGQWQDEEAPTFVNWRVDRLYGTRLPADARVRHEALGDAERFVWDARNDDGVPVSSGWYSIKITMTDGLGRETAQIVPVRVGDLLPDGEAVSYSGAASQREAYASGRWAVWSDQRLGDWDIWYRPLDVDAPGAPLLVKALNQERPHTDGRYVVWQDRQADGNYDIWIKPIEGGEATAITSTAGQNETRPVVSWPWVVYQSQSVADQNNPTQLFAHNIQQQETFQVDPTDWNQADPRIDGDRIVWQDFRDAGFGEIYFANLRTRAVRRITDDPGGQYHPVIDGKWIVWADNRDGDFDLYGFNLKRGVEVALTDTAINETRPHINDGWVTFEADTASVEYTDLRMMNLGNLATIQLTNTPSEKEKPVHADGELVWVDHRSGKRDVMHGALPNLQAVYNNKNAVALTAGLIARASTAHELLALWQAEAGVTALTRYTTLLPSPAAEEVRWENGAPVGDDFNLEAGSFLWVEFADGRVVDLIDDPCNAPSLSAGVNAFGFACFPDDYSAWQLVRELGAANVNAVRMLDSATGRWVSSAVVGGQLAGDDFAIPRVAVVMLDMAAPVAEWNP
ncbi:MAG: hypothetical protein ACE366_28850 [Bradymonadia bacterium]